MKSSNRSSLLLVAFSVSGLCACNATPDERITQAPPPNSLEDQREGDAGVTDTHGKKYFIVLNRSAQALKNVKVQLHGVGGADAAAAQGEKRRVDIVGGVITDGFAPHSVHVYVV